MVCLIWCKDKVFQIMEDNTTSYMMEGRARDDVADWWHLSSKSHKGSVLVTISFVAFSWEDCQDHCFHYRLYLLSLTFCVSEGSALFSVYLFIRFYRNINYWNQYHDQLLLSPSSLFLPSQTALYPVSKVSGHFHCIAIYSSAQYFFQSRHTIDILQY